MADDDMGAMGASYGISYVLRYVDNITPTVERIADSQGILTTAVGRTSASIDSQRISFMSSVMAVRSLHMGFGAVIGSMHELGLTSDFTNKQLMKVNAVVGIVAGSFQMLRGGVQVLRMLQAAEAYLAGIETYRAVLKNPLMLGAMAMATSAGAGVVGYYIGRGEGTTTVTQNVTFGGYTNADQRSAAKGVLESMGGL